MGARPGRRRYCRCGTHLAADNDGRQCARCQRDSRDKFISPPEVPAGFWQTEQFDEAFAAQHIGRVARAYRMHPYHCAVHGPAGVSQGLLGQWLGLKQPQISRIENGPPIRNLDTLRYWARVLRIPPELLWFDMPGETRRAMSSHRDGLVVTASVEEGLRNVIPLPPPPPTGQQILLPLVVDGQSVLLPLAPKTFTSGNFGGFLGELQTTLAAASFPSVAESLLSLDLDFDELHHTAAALADAHRYLDGSVVDYFRRQLDVCEADDGALGPAKVLPVALGILGAIEKHAGEVKAGVRCELLSVGARGAEFAGWLYRDLHHSHRTRYWHDRAAEWAQEACDTTMQGYVLLKKAQAAYDDRDALRMLTLTQATQNGLWQLPTRVQAEVAQQEARGLAMLGEPMSLIERKLDDARQLLDDAASDDEQPGQPGMHYNSSLLTMQTAICYTESGQPRRAAELYRDWLSGNTFSRRDYGYFLSLRAHSLALAGEPDEAAIVGLESFPLARETSSQRTVHELTKVIVTLTPWSHRTTVRELREAVIS